MYLSEGLSILSISSDKLSVGPLIPVTTGLIHGGVLCILSGKYILSALLSLDP